MSTPLRPTARVILMELALLATHGGYRSLAMGRVEPGQVWTSTRRLAAHVAMSKTTIRRALRQLIVEGKVQCLPTRMGTLITMTDDERQVDMFFVEPKEPKDKTSHQVVVDAYFEVYTKLYGQKPRWSPQQGKTLRDLLKNYSSAEVEKRLRKAATDWTEREGGKALTFGAFARNFDAFVVRPKTNNAFSAWETTAGIISEHGFSYGAKLAKDHPDKKIWAAIVACGGWHYVCHTNTHKIRAAFYRSYNEAR